MLDVYHLPKSSGSSEVFIFTNPSVTTNLMLTPWTRPRGKTMCHIICIGGGGGGGGGFTRAAAVAGGGGGSGATGGLSRYTGPCPDLMYMQVGGGGAGVGSGGGTAASGIRSYVSIGSPNVSGSGNVLLISSNSDPGGGGTGTGAAVGAAGSGCTPASVANSPWAGMGQFLAVAGQAGFAGGAVAGGFGGASSYPGTSLLMWNSSGGAGTTGADFAGGAFTAAANSWLSEQRPATPAAGSVNGCSGTNIFNPAYFFFGGTGGSSSNAGVGGNGGNGGFGCGGAGGGAGTTGGTGGRGGSGIIILTVW